MVFREEKHLEQDLNLVSVYGITVDSSHHRGITTITVRTHEAKKPEGFGYKFTIDEVVELTVSAVREDYPDTVKFLINLFDKPFKPSAVKQDGGDQRATPPDSTSKDEQKPGPKSKGRSE